MSAPYTTADATVSARRGADIVPSDTVDLPEPTRGIYVGGGGNIKIDFVSGGTVTFVGWLGGTILPVQALRVYATGTTATNMIALY